MALVYIAATLLLGIVFGRFAERLEWLHAGDAGDNHEVWCGRSGLKTYWVRRLLK